MILNQNPYYVRLLPVVKKKPKFAPAPPSDFEQIRQLVYESKSTDTEKLIEYIYRKLSDEGVLYTLVNKLYDMRSIDICFYVPEIVYLAVKRNCKPIIKFLVDKVQFSYELFCLIYWNVQAFGFQMKEKSKQIGQRLDKMEKNIRASMFNSPMDVQQKGFLPTLQQVEELRKVRNEHFIFSSKFISKLVKTSLDLKLLDESIRKDTLKAAIVKFNNSIRVNALKHKDLGIRYCNGITIPFRKQRGESFSSTLVVNIVENQCSCFNTRKRVPYRIVLETIDMNDLNKYQPRYKKGEKERQKTIVTMTDTFLDDIPTDQPHAIDIIKEDQSKFKNLDIFFTKIKKQEQQKKLDQPHDSNSNLLQNLLPFGQGLLKLTQSNNPSESVVRRSSVPIDPRSLGTLFNRTISTDIRKPVNIIIPTFHGMEPSNQEKYTKNLQMFQAYFPKNRHIKTRKSTGDACKLLNKQFLRRKQTRIFNQGSVGAPPVVRYFSERKIKQAPIERNSFLEVIHTRVNNLKGIRRINSIYEHIQQQEEDRQYEPLWIDTDNVVKKFGPWEELWGDKVKRFRHHSPYSHFPSYKLRNCIIKGGDDLRQEIVCMQLIYKFKEVFLDANLPLYLRPYEIIVLNESSGILEFVTNSISIDGLKKSYENYNNLLDFYKDMFGNKLQEFQTNFVNSLAASSLLTYILQVKDRHNGNILIDSDGHIVHIDFGFIFCISPGGLNFQSSPFKLTAEYIELMEGKESKFYNDFRRLFIEGFLELRKHVDSICSIVEIMSDDSDLPCFHQFSMPVFRDRFKQHLPEDKFREYCEGLIEQSAFNWRTVQYDYFQHLTNDIAQ